MNSNSQVQFLGSKLLTDAGVLHGWFMRYGGVSEGAFKSLNVKKGNGDTEENVNQNRMRALSALSVSGKQLAFIMHSFGKNITKATRPGEYKNSDAIITKSKDIVIAHATADCGSIIIASKDGSVVGIIHSSWHTLSNNLIKDVILQINQHSSAELIAGIGPMVCKNCYEYGSEAEQLFDKKYLHKSKDKLYVDLKSMIIDQLNESGVSKIDDLNICTIEDKRFFSHRRDGADSGRFLTLANLI